MFIESKNDKNILLPVKNMENNKNFGELCLQFSWQPIKMNPNQKISSEMAKKIGDDLGVDWDNVILEEFHMGVNVEMEHGTMHGLSNITNDEIHVAGLIALAHLVEGKHYYTWLKQLEEYMDANDTKPNSVFLADKK